MTDSQRGRIRPAARRGPGQAHQSPPDDHTLLQGVADGDEAALATLYDKWRHRVHTIASWILKDADEAEDVVEETFWQIWRTAGRYDPRRAAAPTWITIIARTRALDRLRTRRRRAVSARAYSANESSVGAAWPAGAEGPPAHERTELHAELLDALRGLPPDQRQTLELAYFGGLSHSEISRSTGQPLGTVKTRVRLAMRRLRQRLASFNEEDL